MYWRTCIWECSRVVFPSNCYLFCTPPSSSTLLETILWAMRMILRYMQLCKTAFAFSSDGITESLCNSNRFLVFEVAHEVQP